MDSDKPNFILWTEEDQLNFMYDMHELAADTSYYAQSIIAAPNADIIDVLKASIAQVKTYRCDYIYYKFNDDRIEMAAFITKDKENAS